MKPVLYGIVGPTASGKTAVGVAVAQQVNAEILSADSVQIYRGMDIGSAKPDAAERQGIPHHMLDVADIDSAGCSVSAFREQAMAAMANIVSRDKLPLLVGGSGLYVDAMTRALDFATPADPAVRRRYEALYEESMELAMQALEGVDPVTAARLHIHDKKRIVRALEVYACAGRPLSSYGDGFSAQDAAETPVPLRLFGLWLPREELYRRIDARVDRMMEAGLETEARTIWARGYDRSLPAMQSIGYKQLFQYFDGLYTLAEAVENIKRDTRRYAKRQMTWFRRNPAIEWFDMSAGVDAVAATIAARIKEDRV